MTSESDTPEDAAPSARRLSYKFQRLRERIRAAVAAGELVGKLPGERSLARQFNVNAKTLSKALTDLAAEGVLERNIGLGTFVRGTGDAVARSNVLVLTTGESTLHEALIDCGLDAHVHTAPDDLPPSLLAPFDTVLIASPDVSDAVIRDLIVRGKAVITLERRSQPYVTHAVLTHADAAAVEAARHMVELGHRRMLVVRDDTEDATPTALAGALPQAEWRPTHINDASAALADGYTAAVCVGTETGRRMLDICRRHDVLVPDAFSVIASGRLRGEPDTCGQYVNDKQVSRAVAHVLSAGLPHKPLTLWLSGELTDHGTTAPPPPVSGVGPTRVIPP